MFQKVNELVVGFEQAQHNQVVGTCGKVSVLKASVEELKKRMVDENMNNNHLYGLNSVKEMVPMPILNSDSAFRFIENLGRITKSLHKAKEDEVRENEIIQEQVHQVQQNNNGQARNYQQHQSI